MKFILQEHKKFILNERFILQEADGDETPAEGTATPTEEVTAATTATTEFKTTLQERLDWVDKLNSALVETIKNNKDIASTEIKTLEAASKDLKDKLKLPASSIVAKLDIVKNSANAYVTAAEQVLTKIGLSPDTHKEAFDALKELGNLDWEVEDTHNTNNLQKLKDWSNYVDSTFKAIVDQADKDQYEQFLQSVIKKCPTAKKNLSKIIESLPIDFTNVEPDSLKKYTKYVTKSNEALKVNSDATIETTKAAIDIYNKALDILIENSNKIVAADDFKLVAAVDNESEEKEKANATARANSQKADWDTLYKLCEKSTDINKANEAFWEGGLTVDLFEGENKTKAEELITEEAKKGYYASEWGNDADLVKDFKFYFIKCLKTLGWDSISNPFVYFLKHNIDNLRDVLSNASFSFIADAYDKKEIDGQDLRGKGSVGTDNIVFSKDLYRKDSAMASYFVNQKALLDKSPQNPKVEVKNLFFIAGNADNLKDEKTAGSIVVSSGESKLREPSQIKQLLQQHYNITTKTVVTDSEITKLVENIKDENKAKKFLSYFLTTVRMLKKDLVKEIDTALNNKFISNYNNIHTTYEEDEAFDKLLALQSKTYKESQLKTIATEVGKVAKFITDEA